MNAVNFVCLATDSDITKFQGALIVLYVLVVPAFAIGAFTWGGSVILGVSQIIVLCLAEATQWRLTRRARLSVKVKSAIATYLASNLIFSLGALAISLWAPNWIPK